jgi:hypothetical protein
VRARRNPAPPDARQAAERIVSLAARLARCELLPDLDPERGVSVADVRREVEALADRHRAEGLYLKRDLDILSLEMTAAIEERDRLRADFDGRRPSRPQHRAGCEPYPYTPDWRAATQSGELTGDHLNGAFETIYISGGAKAAEVLEGMGVDRPEAGGSDRRVDRALQKLKSDGLIRFDREAGVWRSTAVSA